jgi:hypothetical protein
VILASRYGAKGDGVSDDTASVQAALQAAAGGGTVRLSRGTYKTTGSLLLREGVSLVGDGWGTEIRYSGDGDCIVWQPTGSTPLGEATVAPAEPLPLLNATIENLRVVSASPASQRAIRVVDGWGATLRKVSIDATSGWKVAGISFEARSLNSVHDLVDDCFVHNAAGDGIDVGPASFSIYIEHSHINDNAGWAVRSTSTAQQNPAEVHIENNDLEGNFKGGVSGSFRASTIRGNHWECASVYPAPFVALGMTDVAYGLAIEDNYIASGSQRGGASYGIDLRPGLAAMGVTISRNQFSSQGVAAIRIANVRQSRIANNWKADAVPAYIDASRGGNRVNDFGLKLRTYRFVAAGLSARRAPGAVPADSRAVATEIVLPEAGYVRSFSASYSKALGDGGAVRVQVLVDGALPSETFDTELSGKPMVTVLDERLAPQFLPGARLSTNVSTNAGLNAGGTLTIEVEVGLGTAGE